MLPTSLFIGTANLLLSVVTLDFWDACKETGIAGFSCPTKPDPSDFGIGWFALDDLRCLLSLVVEGLILSLATEFGIPESCIFETLKSKCFSLLNRDSWADEVFKTKVWLILSKEGFGLIFTSSLPA